ncbi:MAG TPA: VCBS repeat-containing protein, partial [Bacilli bacterium]
TCTWITWDTSSYSGTSVYFEAVDNHTGSGYAWLAVDGQDPIIPTIGRYNSTQAVGQSHGQTFKNMGIDFAFVDNTNNTIWGSGNASNPTDYIWDNTKATADGFAQVIGGPKVAALLSITSWDGPSTQVQRLFKNYAVAYPWIPTNAGDLFLQKVGMVYNELGYNSAKYFYYEGKPLLGLYVAPAATVYDENDVDQTATTGKLPDSWNPVIPNTGGQTIRQLFTIRWVGAFINGSGNPKYVASTGDTLKAFRGHWSWEDGTPQSWASRANSWGDTPEAVTVSPYARNPIQGRNNGITFRDMWYRAFDVDPLISVIHTWNEFASSGDEFSIENSQSIEPTTLYYKDTYKNLAQNYITHFKKSRMDIGLYDSFGRQIYFKNRKNDYSGYTFEFGHETSYSMDRGSGVESLSGDFDGNGRTDIALRNIADGTIAIRYSPFFTVESSGGQPGEKVVTLESGSRYKAFVGDFNGDGKADIGFYDSVGGGGPGFIIRYNDGNSNFGTVYTWAWSLSGSYQYGSAKINNDGRWDIVYRDPSTGTISFAFANSDGLQTKPTSIYTYSWASGTHYQLMTGDANSDNYGDIGVRDTSNGAIFMRENFKNSTGSTWNFGNEKGMVWASGSHYLPITGDFR